MEAVSPVFSSSNVETIYAKKISRSTLRFPTFRTEKAVISRWKLTEEERKHIADGGDLFICVLNFGMPLQPILPIAADADAALTIMLAVVEEFG
jgi:hypothetical protein